MLVKLSAKYLLQTDKIHACDFAGSIIVSTRRFSGAARKNVPRTYFTVKFRMPEKPAS